MVPGEALPQRSTFSAARRGKRFKTTGNWGRVIFAEHVCKGFVATCTARAARIRVLGWLYLQPSTFPVAEPFSPRCYLSPIRRGLYRSRPILTISGARCAFRHLELRFSSPQFSGPPGRTTGQLPTSCQFRAYLAMPAHAGGTIFLLTKKSLYYLLYTKLFLSVNIRTNKNIFPY